VALLLLLSLKNSEMQQEDINRYCFLGEVTEDFHQDGQRWMKTVCTPGRIMIKIPENTELHLGDRVKITCSLKVEKSEKQSNV
jgi:hypothetical protein